VQQLNLPRNADITEKVRTDIFDGIVTLTAPAKRADTADWANVLYRTSPPVRSDQHLVAVPYYIWNNRARGSMQVWICESL
jgi:DUF1680 family protein